MPLQSGTNTSNSEEETRKKATEFAAKKPKKIRKSDPISSPVEVKVQSEGSPVDIRTFIEAPDYLGMNTGVWPGVKDDLEAMSQPGILGAIIEDGIGAGKSYRVSIKLLYDLYRLAYEEICLGQDPRPRFDLDSAAVISMATVSLNAKQAKKVVFGYCSAFVDRSPWFREYLPRDPRISSELRFFGRRYSVFPGHGHQSSVIGLDLFSCVIDEANFFTVAEDSGTSGIDYVEEMHDAIESRIRSRFGMDGFLGVISSRRTVDDFTARKKRALQKNPDTARRYYLPPSRPAWWGWPERKKQRWRWREFERATLRFVGEPVEHEQATHRPGLMVPEPLWDSFATNPESALRDHVSIPSEVTEPFIRRRDKIRPEFEMVSPVLPHVQPRDWLKNGVRFEDLVREDFFGDPEEWYHFHVDLAEKWDACGIAITRKSGVDQVAISKGERRPEKAALIDVELLIQIKAPPGGEIDFATVRKIIYWLRDERGFRFRTNSFDGYQSTDSVQIMQRRGFVIEKLSVDKNLEPYITLKDALYEGRLFFPPAHEQTPETPWDSVVALAEKGDPMAVFQVELTRLELVNDKKVDHPPRGSKDLADAVCGAVTQASRFTRTTLE